MKVTPSGLNEHITRTAWLCATCLIILGTLAEADTVDARQELEALLRSKGTVQKTRVVRRPWPTQVCGCNDRGHCHCWNESQMTPVEEAYPDYLKVMSVNVVTVTNIVYRTPVLNSVPTKYHIKSVTEKNCTTSKQTIDTTLTLTYQNAQSVSWSRTVSTGTSYTVSLSTNQAFNFGYASGGMTESGSVTFKHDTSTTDGTQQTWTDTVNASEQVRRDVPSMHQVWGSLQVVEGDMGVPFQAEVILDGAVDGNLNNIAHVSDVLNEKERTFVIDGAIHATAASGDMISFYEKELTEADCINHKGTFGVQGFDGSASLLPLLPPSKEALAARTSLTPPNTISSTDFGTTPNRFTAEPK